MNSLSAPMPDTHGQAMARSATCIARWRGHAKGRNRDHPMRPAAKHHRITEQQPSNGARVHRHTAREYIEKPPGNDAFKQVRASVGPNHRPTIGADAKAMRRSDMPPCSDRRLRFPQSMPVPATDRRRPPPAPISQAHARRQIKSPATNEKVVLLKSMPPAAPARKSHRLRGPPSRD